jgi:outer membrane receptor for ferrienterochelin and colicins
MIKSLISLLFGFFSLLAITSGYGQKAVIKVIDKTSKEPVPFCHVCFEGLTSGHPKYAITSIDGIVENDVKEISKVVISYVGYNTNIDTIRPNQSITVILRPKILNMDEVVITAQYVPERADKSIYKVEVISARQIEQKAATNMADILKDQPTMRVTQDAVFGTTLKMQGLSGENVKFLMDGVPMIGRMNGNFDLNQINLYNVDHIEVIEGPMSVIYGSNALAGVINIITKENRSSLLNATATAYSESVGVYNFDGAITLSKSRHGFSLNGGRNFFGGYSNVDTSRYLDFKPRRQYFFDSYYSFTMANFKMKIAGDYFNELLIDKGLLLPPYYETAFDNDFTTIRYSLRADAALKLSQNQFISALAAYSVWNRARQTFFNDLTTLTQTPVEQPWARDTSTIYSITARLSYSKNNSTHKLNYQAGIDISHETGTGEKIQDFRQEIGDYALFASLKYDPVKNIGSDRVILSIQPGIRFIYNTKYQAPVVYALSARWSMLDNMALRFSYSRGFRSPSIKELYLSFIDVNHDIQGNPELQAENSNNFNLNLNYGTELKKHAISIDFTGYYNLINNVILLAQVEPNTASYTYRNISKYKSTGFQLGSSFAFYPSFKLQAGFSITGITGSVSDTIPFEDYQWSPEFTISPSYQFLKQDLSLSLFYKYTGQAYQLGMEEGNIDWQKIFSYNTLDFTATKGFWNSRIKLSAGVKNIFNTTTIPTTGNTIGGGHSGGGDGSMNVAWGRTFFVRLSIIFNKYK